MPARLEVTGDQMLVLIVWNILGYSFFLYSTLQTIIGQGDIYHSRKETYLSPAPWAYLIWSPIVFSLTGYLFHQFTQNGRKLIVEKIFSWFPIFVFLTSGYIHAWMAGYYVLAFFAIFFAGIAAYSIHEIIKSHTLENFSIADQIFVQYPFSLIEGWLVVLIYATSFEAFGLDSIAYRAGTATKVFVFLSLFGCHSRAISFALSPGDIPASIAMAWSVFAIYARQNHPGGSGFVITWSLVCAILCTAWCVLNLVKMGAVLLALRSISNDEERNSLVNV